MKRLMAAICAASISSAALADDWIENDTLNRWRDGLQVRGFDEPAIKAIEQVRVMFNMNKICGDEYMSREQFSGILGILSDKVNVPKSILIDEASELLKLTMTIDRQNALAFCRSLKKNK